MIKRIAIIGSDIAILIATIYSIFVIAGHGLGTIVAVLGIANLILIAIVIINALRKE